MVKKQPIFLKAILLFLSIIVFTYLFSACALTTDRDVTSVVNTAWRFEDKYVFFYQSTGKYNNSEATVEFTYVENDGYIQATYGEDFLEFTHLKGGKMFLVSENIFFYAYQQLETQIS